MTTATGGRGNEELSSKKLSKLPPQQGSPVTPETETSNAVSSLFWDLNCQQTSGMPAAKQRCSEEALMLKRSRALSVQHGGKD